jgi:hypothetical protein
LKGFVDGHKAVATFVVPARAFHVIAAGVVRDLAYRGFHDFRSDVSTILVVCLSAGAFFVAFAGAAAVILLKAALVARLACCASVLAYPSAVVLVGVVVAVLVFSIVVLPFPV